MVYQGLPAVHMWYGDDVPNETGKNYYWHSLDTQFAAGLTRLHVKMPDGTWAHQHELGMPLKVADEAPVFDNAAYTMPTNWQSLLAARALELGVAEIVRQWSLYPWISGAYVNDWVGRTREEHPRPDEFYWDFRGATFSDGTSLSYHTEKYWLTIENLVQYKTLWYSAADIVNAANFSNVTEIPPHDPTTDHLPLVVWDQPPTYRINAYNGRPAAKFDAAGSLESIMGPQTVDVPGTADMYLHLPASGYTVFCVTKDDDIGHGGVILELSCFHDLGSFAFFGPSFVDVGHPAIGTGGDWGNDFHEYLNPYSAVPRIHEWRVKAGAVRYRREGVEQSPVDGDSSLPTPVGADYQYHNDLYNANFFIGNEWSGLWFETRVYPTIDEGFLAGVRAELSATYDLPA